MQSKRPPSGMAGPVLAAILCLASPAAAQQPDERAIVPGMDPWRFEIEDAPQWEGAPVTPELAQRSKRHQAVLQEGVPIEYSGRKSPYPAATRFIRDGARLYAAHCARCHGQVGFGDGEAGKALTPSPALLAYLIQRPEAADAFLLWSVAEGGARFGTDMPAFKGKLSEREIWQIVAYMRAGFPPVGTDE